MEGDGGLLVQILAKGLKAREKNTKGCSVPKVNSVHPKQVPHFDLYNVAKFIHTQVSRVLSVYLSLLFLSLSLSLTMSMINDTTISNLASGSTLWQYGSEFQFHQAVATTDDYHRWRSVASRLAFDNELRMAERYANTDDDGHCRKNHFPDMLLKFSEMKIQHPFHGQQPDKWHKTLPPAEMLPRNEVLGGFIFVCNNETMQEDLRRQLFGKLTSLGVIVL